MVRRFLLCLLVLIMPIALFAGAGKMAGSVVDKTTGKPLAGVNIIVEDAAYTLGAASNIEGYYVIMNVPDGLYTVRASYMGRKTVKVNGVRVSSGLTTELNFEMEQKVIEGEVVEVTAERKLFRKDATSNVGMATAEDIENIPVRGTQELIANMAGVIVQDGAVHIRGGRDNEVGYYVNGVSTVNPVTNRNAVHVIQEAVEEIQVLTGGFTADMGGANSGVVKTELRTGSSKLKGSIDYRRDGFGDPEDGNQMFNTYSYGHQTGVATLSGPLFTNKINFFVAGEYRNQADDRLRQSSGYEFLDQVDMSTANDPYGHDTVDVIYPDGFTPKQSFESTSINGTMTFDLPIRITLGGMYTHTQDDRESSPMLSSLNDRYQYNDYTSSLLTAKATKTFSSTSYLEVKLSRFNSVSEFRDNWFDGDWEKWWDSTAVYDHSLNLYDGDSSKAVSYRDAWNDLPGYSIHGIPMERNGNPSNTYRINKQEYWGVKADYKTQLGKHHEIQTGVDYRSYTIRYFDIAP